MRRWACGLAIIAAAPFAASAMTWGLAMWISWATGITISGGDIAGAMAFSALVGLFGGLACAVGGI